MVPAWLKVSIHVFLSSQLGPSHVALKQNISTTFFDQLHVNAFFQPASVHHLSDLWPSLMKTGSVHCDVTVGSSILVYSARFFANTADTLRTIPRTPAKLFLSARFSLTRSTSWWNTSRTPWYVSAADTSKKAQCWDRASSLPSSPETLRWLLRSRLFPTMTTGADDSFLLRRICCSCRRTTSKLRRSQIL